MCARRLPVTLLAALTEISHSGYEGFRGLGAVLSAEAVRNKGLLPYDPGYVYIIWAKKTSWFKIGKSNNVDRRFAQISPKLMHETMVVRRWAVPFMSKAEVYLHKIFEKYRGNGEWFNLPKTTILEIFEDLAWEYAELLNAVYWHELMACYKRKSLAEYQCFCRKILQEYGDPGARSTDGFKGNLGIWLLSTVIHMTAKTIFTCLFLAKPKKKD